MARIVLYPSGQAPPPTPPAPILGWQGISIAVLAGATIIAGSFSNEFLTPRGVDPPNTAVNWQTHNPEVFRAPFPATAQQYDAMPWQGFVPTAATPQGWYPQPPDQFATPRSIDGKSPFMPALQQYDAEGWQGNVPSGPHKEGWEGQQLEVKFAVPFQAALQPPGTFLRGAIPSAATPHGWEGQQLDYKFAVPFPAHDQQFLIAFEPEGAVPSRFPDGWRSYQWEIGYAKPVPASAQPYNATFTRGSVPVQRTGQWFPQAPDLFVRPLSPASQQFLAGTQQQFVSGLVFQGQQLDYRFAQPLPPAQQQWSSFQPLGFILPTFIGGWWGDHEYLFAKPFPVESQLFATWDLVGEVPPFRPPGGSRRKDITPFVPEPPYRVKPQPPFRPVWDKPREGVIERHPIPLPPASLFTPTPPPAGMFAPRNAAPPPLALPDFKNMVPPDHMATDTHMRDVQDQADIMALLRSMGIGTDEGGQG